MSEVGRYVGTTPDTVFAVLADGWTLGLWVVGAVHIRDVDPDWPAVGARVHHSVGAWPLMLEDRTEVEAVTEGRMLQLRAHAGPAGSARVVLTLTADGGGTRVTMSEDAIDGPGTLVPEPVRSALVALRNQEALARLDALARGREREAAQR
ncbi:MAG: SRPBCC family protein [Actinomycetota bacterium]|nr:SRPBCC family protein [Actinomycetota bacterium]